MWLLYTVVGARKALKGPNRASLTGHRTTGINYSARLQTECTSENIIPDGMVRQEVNSGCITRLIGSCGHPLDRQSNQVFVGPTILSCLGRSVMQRVCHGEGQISSSSGRLLCKDHVAAESVPWPQSMQPDGNACPCGSRKPFKAAKQKAGNRNETESIVSGWTGRTVL